MPDSRQILGAAALLVAAVLAGWLWGGRAPAGPARKPAAVEVAAGPAPTAPRRRPEAIPEFRTPRPTRVPTRRPPPRTAPPTPEAFDERDPLVTLPTPGRLPDSLQGTEVDGDLVLGDDGHFLPTPDALRLFDYFLSAQGEEPLEAIYDRIVHEARRRLPPDAAREAIEFLDTYLGYREVAAARLKNGLYGGGLREETLLGLKKLRRDLFGADVAERIFEAQEEEELSAIAMGGGREEAEAAWMKQIQDELRQSPGLSLAEVHALTAGIENYGQWDAAAQAEFLAKLEAKSGKETAARLLELGAARADWKRRVAAYRVERRSLESTPGLSQEERQEMLRQLREAHFQPHEFLRIEMLDRIELRREPRP